jgi:hypothetical protein
MSSSKKLTCKGTFLDDDSLLWLSIQLNSPWLFQEVFVFCTRSKFCSLTKTTWNIYTNLGSKLVAYVSYQYVLCNIFGSSLSTYVWHMPLHLPWTVNILSWFVVHVAWKQISENKKLFCISILTNVAHRVLQGFLTHSKKQHMHSAHYCGVQRFDFFGQKWSLPDRRQM